MIFQQDLLGGYRESFYKMRDFTEETSFCIPFWSEKYGRLELYTILKI